MQVQRELSLWQLVWSVLASFFGVQTDANRERDFNSGRLYDFVIAGIVLTVVFVLTLWGTVQLIMP